MQHSQRSAAWAGIAFVVLVFVGLALAPLVDLGAGTSDVSSFLSNARPWSYIAGGCADVLAYIGLLVFVLGLTRRARGAEREGGGDEGAGDVATVAIAGIVLAAATVTAGLVLVEAVVLNAASTPVPTAQVLLTAASVATWGSELGVALSLAAFAVLARRVGGTPAWAMWSAGVLALLLAAAVPFASTGVAHIPAVLVDAWVIALAVVLMRRPRVAAQVASAQQSDRIGTTGA